MIRTLALAAFMALAADAQECSTLSENMLTSKDCPSRCDQAPCVLYAPNNTKGVHECASSTDASGPCYHTSGYRLPVGDGQECDVTYKCLEQLVDDNRQWLLSVGVVNDRDVNTMAYVTQVKNLEYSNNVVTVQLSGGRSDLPKGDMKNVSLDQSFFDTPTDTGGMFLMHLNLRNIMNKVELSKSLNQLYLVNANLNKVPDNVQQLDLRSLKLAKNYLKSFPSDVLTNLETLDLAENAFEDLSLNLQKLTSLNLTGNPLTTIPADIFSLESLSELYMESCKLENIQLSPDQIAFLTNLKTFSADMTVSECEDGYTSTTLQTGSVQVCTKSGGEGALSTGATIGIIVAVVVVTVVAAVIGFVVYRRRNGSKQPFSTGGKNHSSMHDTDMTQGMLGDGTDTFGSSLWDDPDLVAYRVEHKDVEAIKLLSRGGFGEVWLGLYMSENVAIKRLLSDKRTMTDALAFAAEIKIMGRLEHPKIVRFIGVSWTNALTIQAITEFMDCGDLKSLLESDQAESLSWPNLKCQIAIDVADALVYLHTLNPKIIHRDLKSRNVLIDAQSGAKLSDFGVSRNRSYEETMTAGVGTSRWIAPEVILGSNYTEFADVYSFGVVLSELDTCKAPYHDATNTNGAKMQDVTILQLVSAGKLQPTFSTSCPQPIVQLARACLSFEPAQRPSAIHISYELRKILRDLQK